MAPTATVSDVDEVYTSDLDDSDITDSLNYAEELNELYNDPSAQDTVETKNIERWGAILNILEYKERPVRDDQAGDSRLAYQGDPLERAKSELSKWDPSGQMASGLIKDSNRYTGSTTET